MKRPNILFITTDQQRKDTLGCYGNPLIKTPNIDALAADGLKLNRAYCENPICIPSRNTMITGKKSYNHGAPCHNSTMSDEVKTLGELLQNNGYETHFIGKAHFSSQQHPGTPESREDWQAGKWEGFHGPYKGFETCELILGHSNPLLAHYGQWMRENHKEDIKKFLSTNLKPYDVSCGQGVYDSEIPEEAHSSTYVGERTCEYIKKMAKQEKPFYCFASFPDPHWPLMAPKEYMHMYDDVEIPVDTEDIRQKNLQDYPEPFQQLIKREKTFYNGGGHVVKQREDIAKITRAYWGCVSLIDKNVGKMIQCLKDTGIYDDTLIIFTTDHGEYMGAHGMMAKGGVLWEEYVNLPFIARYGDHIKKQESDALFSLVDVVPTLIDFAGVTNDLFTVDGISQKAVFEGEKKESRDLLSITHATNQLSCEIPDQECIITKDGMKLVYFAKSQYGQLYNLKNDPHEENNLYSDPAYKEILNELKLQLLDELITHRGRDAQLFATHADRYGSHILTYDFWKKEFDELELL